MKTYSKKEVYQMFDSLFRFDDYEDGYVTSGMATKHLEKTKSLSLLKMMLILLKSSLS